MSGQRASLIVVSACLAGIRCRYDGKSRPVDPVVELVRAGKALPLCPEQLGGLPTPRSPHERVKDRFLSKSGTDATEAFKRGANEALRIVLLAGCKAAILKSRSPSCGSGRIYDGTFTGRLVTGNGIFAEALKAHHIEVMTEEDL